MYLNREPRFYMSVFYEGLNWIGGSNTVSSIQFYYGGNSGQTSSNFNYPLTGYLPFKFQDTGFDSKNAGSAQANWTAITWPLFRYAEVLLYYAEALNRQPERDATAALAAINAVRKRAGVADIETIYPEVEADADALEAMIRRERMIELNFENHRFFDTRMWLIAEQENAGAVLRHEHPGDRRSSGRRFLGIGRSLPQTAAIRLRRAYSTSGIICCRFLSRK